MQRKGDTFFILIFAIVLCCFSLFYSIYVHSMVFTIPVVSGRI